MVARHLDDNHFSNKISAGTNLMTVTFSHVKIKIPHFPWNWLSSVKNIGLLKIPWNLCFPWVLTHIVSYLKTFRLLIACFYTNFYNPCISHFEVYKISNCWMLLTSYLNGWLGSVMVKVIGLTTQWSWVQLPAVVLSGNSVGQAVHTHVPLSPSSISW